ncbi:cell wall-binding repeat-containing protein [Embleya sp. NPDC055664]|uniref:cell wall-binding repeat-containing protein n=1 Tax=Embleya sp. NPDC059237 TaxID=3346784 RepID=UPI0036C491C5
MALLSASALAGGMLVALVPTSAQAALSGGDGVIAGTTTSTNHLEARRVDGTSVDLGLGDGLFPSYSPDGSHVTFVRGDRLQVARVGGAHPIELTGASVQQVVMPRFSPDGRYIHFTASLNGSAPKAYRVLSDGNGTPVPAFEGQASCDRYVSANSQWMYVFQRGCGTDTSVWSYNATNGATAKIADDAGAPDISPDGKTVVFVRVVANTGRLYSVDTTGGQPKQLSADTDASVSLPSFSPSGTRIAYGKGSDTWVMDKNGDNAKRVAANFWQASWQPLRKEGVYRVWGDTAHDTAIANSKFKWASVGDTSSGLRQADSAVISRTDYFYDGLSGAALAGAKNGPLLLGSWGGPGSLYEELTRTLRPGSNVYILGGINALSTNYEDDLRQWGFTPKRLAGATMYDTGIAIARETNPAPKNVFVVTGEDYYDGLSAGAAAGGTKDSVVVYSAGDNMPAVTESYLNAINPATTNVITVGGPADRALLSANLPSWPDGAEYYAVAGNTAADTAAKLGRFWFAAPRTVGLATTMTWQDALTGGAMMAGLGPILLTDEDSLAPASSWYLYDNGASLSSVVLVGGESALNAPIVDQAGNQIGLPGQYTYVPMYNGVEPPAGKALRAAPADKPGSPAVNGPASGTGPQAGSDVERHTKR